MSALFSMRRPSGRYVVNRHGVAFTVAAFVALYAQCRAAGVDKQIKGWLPEKAKCDAGQVLSEIRADIDATITRKAYAEPWNAPRAYKREPNPFQTPERFNRILQRKIANGSLVIQCHFCENKFSAYQFFAFRTCKDCLKWRRPIDASNASFTVERYLQFIEQKHSLRTDL